MTEVVVGEQIAKTIFDVLKPFLGFIAAAAIGFAAAETWEHTNHPSLNLGFMTLAPFGQSLSTQLAKEKASEPAKIQAATQAGIMQQIKSDALAFTQWQAALDTANASAKSARNAAAQSAIQASAAISKQASAAYQLGRATCGASNALPSISGPGGQPPAAGGVPNDPSDDFSAIFATGAYAPPSASPVPSGGG